MSSLNLPWCHSKSWYKLSKLLIILHKTLSKSSICFQTLGIARDILYTAVKSRKIYSPTYPPKLALPYIKCITVEKVRNHFLEHLYPQQYLVKEINCWAKVTVPKLKSQLPKAFFMEWVTTLIQMFCFQDSWEQNDNSYKSWKCNIFRKQKKPKKTPTTTPIK